MLLRSIGFLATLSLMAAIINKSMDLASSRTPWAVLGIAIIIVATMLAWWMMRKYVIYLIDKRLEKEPSLENYLRETETDDGSPRKYQTTTKAPRKRRRRRK